jgi:hypothetical protein
MGESSNTLPVFTEIRSWHSLVMHFQTRRLLKYDTRLFPQCGQVIPSGQRMAATKSTHTSPLVKYRIISSRFLERFWVL